MTVLEGDHIAAAWCERCSGPGWSNDIVWVLVQSKDGELRVDSMQPHEQQLGIETLHPMLAVGTEQLLRRVRSLARQSQTAEEANP